jgi:hypothetical protein
VVGDVIEQEGAVAGHPHVLSGDHEPSLIALREVPLKRSTRRLSCASRRAQPAASASP